MMVDKWADILCLTSWSLLQDTPSLRCKPGERGREGEGERGRDREGEREGGGRERERGTEREGERERGKRQGENGKKIENKYRFIHNR